MTQVKLEMSDLALMGILRLPEAAKLLGAEAKPSAAGSHGVLTLTLDLPDVPEGAAFVRPAYTHAVGWPDPVSLTRLQWFREDQTEIGP